MTLTRHIKYRLGGKTELGASLYGFAGPCRAQTLLRFWQNWTPVFRYDPLKFVDTPTRKFMSRPIPLPSHPPFPALSMTLFSSCRFGRYPGTCPS